MARKYVVVFSSFLAVVALLIGTYLYTENLKVKKNVEEEKLNAEKEVGVQKDDILKGFNSFKEDIKKKDEPSPKKIVEEFDTFKKNAEIDDVKNDTPVQAPVKTKEEILSEFNSFRSLMENLPDSNSNDE